MEKALKAAVFSKDYKDEWKKINNLTKLLAHLENPTSMNIRDNVAELQDLVPNDDNPRYPKFRDPTIPHDKFDREDAKKATELAKKILDEISANYF